MIHLRFTALSTCRLAMLPIGSNGCLSCPDPCSSKSSFRRSTPYDNYSSFQSIQYCIISRSHCVKSVQIRSNLRSLFSLIRTEYGPEITPYLDTFHAVSGIFSVDFGTEDQIGTQMKFASWQDSLETLTNFDVLVNVYVDNTS